MSTEKRHNREFLKGDWQEGHSYSLAVTATGSKTIYLSGVGAWEDESKKSLEGDFAGQTRFVFREIRRTLEKLGAGLDDIVSTTTYVTDMKYRPQFIEIRKEFFTKGFPASALIGIKELARPPMMIEVQAIAVVD